MVIQDETNSPLLVRKQSDRRHLVLAAVDAAIAQLAESERAVIYAVTDTLMRSEALRGHVLAKQLGMSNAVFCSHLALAIQKLRRTLEDNQFVVGWLAAVPQTTTPAIDVDLMRRDSSSPVRIIVDSIRQLTPDLVSHLRRHTDDLQHLDWKVFEQLIAELMVSWGFDRVHLVGSRGDTAADIFAVQKIEPLGLPIRYFVEVKRWKDRIGVEVIDRVLGAMMVERPRWGWHLAMVITLAGAKRIEKYTEEQLDLLGIQIRDRTHVEEWLNAYKPAPSGLWLPSTHDTADIS